jgi:hypothetical protein
MWIAAHANGVSVGTCSPLSVWATPLAQKAGHMSSDRSSGQAASNRKALRTFVVIALAPIVLASSLPDLRRLWQPLGNFGMSTTDPQNVITSVDENSPAARAGMKAGDRIDVAATEPIYRFPVTTANCNPCTLLAGQTVSVAVVHDRQRGYLSMTSEPEPLNPASKALIVAREFQMLLFLGLGMTLVLLRPSIATWAFYFYCLGRNFSPVNVTPLSLGLPWSYVDEYISTGLQLVGLLGIVIFALLFLQRQLVGWRATVCYLSSIAVTILLGLYTYGMLADGWFGWGSNNFNNFALKLFQFLIVSLQLMALCAFMATYISARGAERQRIRWIVLGFGMTFAGSIAIVTIPVISSPHLYWLYESLTFFAVLVPLTVSYAVIKHRVIDVSFVVSRALVYGVLTTLLVGIFSVVDWFFTDYLRLARLGTVAEVGAVVAFGFWFNGLHRRVDTIIDATFFRQRHRAEVQLARNAAALPLATTTTTIAQALVDEPVRALSLASAALFRRGSDGVYVRQESQGWAEADIAKLDAKDEHLLTLAQAENGPLSLYDHPWRSEGVPTGPASPVLALPIIVRRALTAVVFYGSHVHGEPLDPDEIRAIAQLGPAAAVAYDHLEAEAMKRENDDMRKENETLRGVIAEFQIQPT